MKILTEHEEQCLLIKWFDLQHRDKIIFAIPNGGQRNLLVAKKLKTEGVRAGVPDLFLAYPNRTHCGLFIEMKRAKNGKLTQAQKDMMFELEKFGYHCVVCHGFDEAKKAIEEYLRDIYR